MVSSSTVDADLPTFEAVSLSHPPLLTPQITDDDETDTDETVLVGTTLTVRYKEARALDG